MDIFYSINRTEQDIHYYVKLHQYPTSCVQVIGNLLFQKY